MLPGVNSPEAVALRAVLSPAELKELTVLRVMLEAVCGAREYGAVCGVAQQLAKWGRDYNLARMQTEDGCTGANRGNGA